MKPIVLIVLSMGLVLNSCAGKSRTKAENHESDHTHVASGDTVEAPGNNIMVIFQDSKNIYWFGSRETGLYRYDGKYVLQYTTKHGLPHNRVEEIKEDQAGNIYLNGCYPFSAITKFDGKTFTRLQPTPTLLQSTASNEWKLQPRDLWFKHPFEKGQVYRYDGTTLHELTLPKNPSTSAPFEIYSIYTDKKGNIWFGTNPAGVCRYNGKSFDWISENDVTELDGGPANGVRSIIEDKNGYFWFNTSYRYSVNETTSSGGNSFYKRQKSIGSLDGQKEGTITEYLSIVSDDRKNLWIATYRDGVWYYDGTNINHFPVQFNGKDIRLYSIFKDNKGDLWLGTSDHGVFKFNGRQFEQYTF